MAAGRVCATRVFLERWALTTLRKNPVGVCGVTPATRTFPGRIARSAFPGLLNVRVEVPEVAATDASAAGCETWDRADAPSTFVVLGMATFRAVDVPGPRRS